jgi:two-component system OmpR family sensor kinase
MIPKTIRVRIIFWHVIALCLTLLLFGPVLYHSVNQRIKSDLNDLLMSKADGIREAIESLWQEEKLDAAKAGIDVKSFSKFHNINFDKMVEGWISENRNDPLLLNIDVQIFNADGKLIASSEKLHRINVGLQTLVRPDFASGSYFEDVSASGSSKKSTKLRALTVAVAENDRTDYFVKVIFPLTSLNSFLSHLKLMLLLLFPFVVVSSGITGALMAKAILRPLHKMMDTIHRIKAENLRLRVKLPPAEDEIKDLAVTFNSMLDRLEQAFSSQRQFIEDLAHELRTPLSVLKGELEVTLKKIRSARDYESILHSSLEEVNRIIKISQNLLTLARYDSNMMSLEKTSLDLRESVEQVLDELNIVAQQKGISLVLSAKDRAFIYGDKTKLHQLFLNLIDNALKFTPSQGTVKLEVCQENDWAKVIISDTGPGIPEKDLSHIFDRFFRVEKSHNETGYGLGLPIAMAIAKAHQGRIEVKSILNRGTIFAVFLPLSYPR